MTKKNRLMGCIATAMIGACQHNVSFSPPGVCDLTRADPLVVEAQITSVSAAVTAEQAGLTASETPTLYFDGPSSLIPLTIDIEGALVGTAPSTSLAVLEAPSGFGLPLPSVDGDAGFARGYFFLRQYGGKWVVASGGYFAWDPATEKLQNGAGYRAPGYEISESNFRSEVASAAQSTSPCEQPVPISTLKTQSTPPDGGGAGSTSGGSTGGAK